jgi:hypothetical protein
MHGAKRSRFAPHDFSSPRLGSFIASRTSPDDLLVSVMYYRPEGDERPA